MKQTEKSLLEQMRFTDFEVDQRKELFGLTSEDIVVLKSAKPVVDLKIDSIVNQFYETQTNVPEIALLIGDADTLNRLRNAQRRYVVDLFTGVYDLEYVNNRLRIGLVHKRIGVEPKLYLSAIHTLKLLLINTLRKEMAQEKDLNLVLNALEKLLWFDITLVFDTYIRSLISEIEISKSKSDQYARALEEKVQQRTQQLEALSRTDPLTGLLNVRHLNETLTSVLRAAQRRSEPVTFLYMDIDDFKKINDEKGHQEGDRAIQKIGSIIKQTARSEDRCFRCGGDEFCMILPNCSKEEAEKIFISRIRISLSSDLEGVSVSVGIVQTGPTEYLPVEQLIKLADNDMYREKNGTKDGNGNTVLPIR